MYQLKEARKAAGLTQKEVAIKLNVTAATYSRYENGLIQPDPKTLLKIANLFNVSIDFLLGYDFSSADTTPENENNKQKEDIKEICALFEKLPDNKKALVLQMARVMLEDKI